MKPRGVGVVVEIEETVGFSDGDAQEVGVVFDEDGGGVVEVDEMALRVVGTGGEGLGVLDEVVELVDDVVGRGVCETPRTLSQ